jgi:tetratricopeptide (TPR) repeat protein
MGRFDEARRHYERALEIVRLVGDRKWEGNTRSNLGLLHFDQGRFDDARAEYEAALAIARAMGDARLECVALLNLGIAMDELGERAQASRCYADALTLSRGLRDRRTEGQILGYIGLLTARLRRFDEATEHFTSGAQLLSHANDPWSLGVLLCGLAEAEALKGDRESALAVLRKVDLLVQELGASSESDIGRARAKVIAGLALHDRARDC